jgi:hypothetical protein
VAVLAVVPPNVAGARAETEMLTVLPDASSPRLLDTNWPAMAHAAPLLAGRTERCAVHADVLARHTWLCSDQHSSCRRCNSAARLAQAAHC